MVRVEGPWLKDDRGRTLMPRGINVDGACKIPFSPDGGTRMRQGFFDHRNVSFVNRPFPLEEADEHFRRLRSWGFDYLRLLVSWEAIEHAGPGIHDDEYLDFLHGIVEKANDHGMNLFIDPHQDVWSRFSGGDGAPGWTLETAGFDLARFMDTGAAFTHQAHGDPLPRMIWPTNGVKLAAATMFTLFFGGADFAPKARLMGEPAQELLQRHYVGAVRAVAQRLRDLPNVLGYEIMNEPLPGYIGWRDLTAADGAFQLGDSPSPFQGMLLGAGIPQEVAVWKPGTFGFARSGTRILNEGGARAWREGRDCIWRENGVWDLDAAGKPELLRPDHFTRVRGCTVDFGRDYLRPFAERFAREIRAVDPRALIFLETESGRPPPYWPEANAANIVFAPHWYDGFVLMRKHFSSFLGADSFKRSLVVGPGAVRRSFRAQLAALARWSRERLGGAPLVLGEFGAPMDLDGGEAYRTGDFRAQVRALDRSFKAVEENLMSAFLWNHTSANTNAHGDDWNGEDFSLFSRDQLTDRNGIDSGGRALEAAVRPYARATAGEPTRMRFDMKRRVFEYEFRHDPMVSAPTEVFVPRLHYPGGCRVTVSDGSYVLRPETQSLSYRHGTRQPMHKIRVAPL
jgi:hypothetical protein